MYNKTLLTEDTLNVFDFLNALRDSGQTNMLGAGQYLEMEFGLNKVNAREYLSSWMVNFNPDGYELGANLKLA